MRAEQLIELLEVFPKAEIRVANDKAEAAELFFEEEYDNGPTSAVINLK